MDDYFIPEVDKRLAAAGGKVKIEWNRAYGGTLVKLGSESTALKDGLGEIGFVSTIFEAPKFPLQNITYYTPFGTDDISIVSKRSEEHTSELQSLMRISYAVLCLTKTK